MRNEATAAENKPAYRLPVGVHNDIQPDLRTHEDENPISIFCPPLGHRVVLCLRSLRIHAKEGA